MPTIRSFKQKENAPALRPGLIDGGSAIGGWGAGPDPPSVLMFLHYEVSNKRKSVVRRSYPLTIFFGRQFQRGPGSGKLGRLNGQVESTSYHTPLTWGIPCDDDL